MQAGGQKNASSQRVTKRSPIYCTSCHHKWRLHHIWWFQVHLTLAKCPLQWWPAPAQALEHKCRDQFRHLSSCATSTGLETPQVFTETALFVWKSGKERQIYLWDPFPSQEVPTCRAFWWLMPGDVSEGTARIGAVSMSPASIGGCLKRELSRIFWQSWKSRSCAAHHSLFPHKHFTSVTQQITSPTLLFLSLISHHTVGLEWVSTVTALSLNAPSLQKPSVLPEFISNCRAEINNTFNLLEKVTLHLQRCNSSPMNMKKS